MEYASTAEKEASEVLRTLLSVDRRGLDSKENIIVSIENGGQELSNSDQAQWHTPVLGQHSVFNVTEVDGMEQGEFNHRDQQQVIWQGHTIQIENGNGETILQELYPIVSITDSITTKQEHQEQELTSEAEEKPLLPKKKKPRKRNRPRSDDEQGQTETEDRGNKLEENPQQVKVRLKKGCDCRDNCFRGLSAENVYKHRLNIAELTKAEHDMYLMGVTMACLANPSETSRHKARRRLRASYVYQGRRVCLEAFLYLENVTHYQLKRIRHHVITHGVAPRVHGNIGKKPYNTFSLDIYKHATEFLKQYLDQHSGGAAKDSKKIFIQGDTRRNLYDAYREYGEILEPGIKLMGYSTFRCFMKEQFPHIKFCTKKADLTSISVPFKSGKCMVYDKNKDPVRIEAEKAKNIAKKNSIAAKKKEKNQIIIQHEIQMTEDESEHQIVVQQQQLQTVQVSQNQQVQQVQTIQQVGQHQIVQQIPVSDDSGSQPIEVIPLTVVQQPQQTYIVTPVSHLQTSVHGAWYSRH